jgi:hypothetical protein
MPAASTTSDNYAGSMPGHAGGVPEHHHKNNAHQGANQLIFNTAAKIPEFMRQNGLSTAQLAPRAAHMKNEAFEIVKTSHTRIQAALSAAFDGLKAQSERHPPLMIYLSLLAVFSILPVFLFVAFSVVSTATTLFLAVIGITVAESVLLLASGSLLLSILLGIFTVTSGCFVWACFVYLLLRSGHVAYCQLRLSLPWLPNLESQQATGGSEFNKPATLENSAQGTLHKFKSSVTSPEALH